ncbi:hypothetical protein OUZ56_024308 [Daphnia magna]|uniref:Uncharacterized protein n=1 Tax=Daphnia magna TaxID=35525 RepID=A0ABR0B0K2_9CRUS|nr:hypothetical protein OUZ56_024308 [Daphnia magna]
MVSHEATSKYSTHQTISFLHSHFLPVDPFTVSIRKGVRLVARPPPHSARRPTLCFCPSIHLLPLPVTSLTASVRQHPLCPSTHSLSAKTPAVVARRPYRCLARPPPHSLCPSTQSLYLPVDSLTVSARRPNHCRPKFPLYLPVESLSLCPSSHLLPTKMPNEVARQLIYCLWLSNP